MIFVKKLNSGLFSNYVTQKGWVDLSVFRDVADEKQKGELHFMKGGNVTVKKIIKPSFVPL